MEQYQKEFARLLAESGALFFRPGLHLKDKRPSPYFVNLGFLKTGRLIDAVGSRLASMLVKSGLAQNLDVILGPSYKGSALAVATAGALWREHKLDVMYEYDRKEAKTHGEASGGKNQFVTGALAQGGRVYIVDDVTTTMATKYDLIEVIRAEADHKRLEIDILGVGLCVYREQTTAVYDKTGTLQEGVKGDDALKRFTATTGVPVQYLVGIREVIDYLDQERIPVSINGQFQPMDRDTRRTFDQYLDLYGV